MLRRSRRTAASSSNPTTPNNDSIASRLQRSRTPRQKSKSVESRNRINTRSASQNISASPRVLEQKDDSSKKKIIKHRSKSRKGMSSKSKDESLSMTIDEKPLLIKNKRNFVSELNDIPIKDLSTTGKQTDDESRFTNHTKVKNTQEISQIGFGGLFSNLILAVLLPVFVILSKIGIKTKGNLIPFPKRYLTFANYYDQDVFMWTAGIVVLQLLISLLPLAKLSEGLSNCDFRIYYYRFTGIFNLIIGALIVAVMYNFKCPVDFILEIVTKKTIPHVVVSVLLGLIISVVLYIKTKYTNKTNKLDTSNFVQNIFIGTTVNPTFGAINIKLALYRYSVLMTIFFNSLVIIYTLKHPVNVPLYFVAGLQIFYALDKLIFEFILLSSFYLRVEKDGYWTIIQQFLQPIINFLPIEILLLNNLPINYIILGISSILFLLGYVCQRYCDLIKYMYETDVKHAGITSGVKTIMTLGGKRIFVTGLLSYIRYPNYLGTILVYLALILPVFEPTFISLQLSWPVLACPLYYILTLFHRSVRVSSYCQLKYGMMWNHQFAVKWNLIPKIF